MSTPKASRALHAYDQQCLFNLGMDLAELREQKEAFVVKAKAPNTLKAYKHSWNIFADWCRATGRASLPTDSETIELFLTWSANERQYRVETIALSLSAINHKHQCEGFAAPVTESVRTVLAGIVRDRREDYNGKDAVSVEHLRKMCKRLDDGDPVHIRDRAIILVGFASAWRRSELSALLLKDVKVEKAGARLWLPRSKGDQEGKGEETEIVYAKSKLLCPVRALEAWLQLRGTKPGPLFCAFTPGRELELRSLDGQRFAAILKNELEKIGEDPKRYGAHSLRAGMITEAARKNVPLVAIMHHSRHKAVQTVVRYVRRELPFRSNPLARVL